MIRSQSLPLLLSSLSMRSAKFGQGTNSNFMLTPLLAVKSFESSTSALAGSQAAQHSVMVLPWAWAAWPLRPSRAAAARAGSLDPRVSSDFMTVSSVWFTSRTHTSDCRQCRFSAVRISTRGCTTFSAPRTFSHKARSTRAAVEMQ